MKTDEERGSWLAQYVLDPQTATCLGFNSTIAFHTAKKKGKSGWVTEAQLAGPLYLNDKAAAKTLCESGDLESRPHEYASLASEGHKQYYYTAEEDVAEAGFSEKAGVKAEAELNAPEFQEVKEHINTNFGKAGKRKTSKQPKEPESDASKKPKTAAAARSNSLRRLKALSDKVHNELFGAEKDIPKLQEKGYPEQMQNFFFEKVAGARKELKDALGIYAEEILKPDAKFDGDVESIQSEAKKVDTVYQNLEAYFVGYKKSAGADIKKLCG